MAAIKACDSVGIKMTSPAPSNASYDHNGVRGHKVHAEVPLLEDNITIKFKS